MWLSAYLAIRGGRPQVPRSLRRASLAIIGCYLGAGAGPEILRIAGRDVFIVFAFSLIVGALTVAAAFFVVRRMLNTDSCTAFLSSVPGGLSMIFALSSDYRGDDRVIGIVQVVRILAVASIIPLWARFAAGEGTEIAANVSAPDVMTTSAWAALFVALAAGFVFGAIMKTSQVFLLAPALAAGAFYAGGLSGSPPPEILYAAQVAVGASVGARINVLQMRAAGFACIWGVVLALFYIASAAGAAALAAEWTEYSFIVMLLAFAPGGIAEICLIAALLNLHPGFVLMAQTMRLVLIVAIAPLAAKRLCGKCRSSS